MRRCSDLRAYGDAFSWLADLCNFEWYTDEFGRIYYVYATDRQPAVNNESNLLQEVAPPPGANQLLHYPIVSGSETVTDSTGLVTYIKDTDYTLDYGTGEMHLIPGGGITEGQTVLVSYVYAAWVFREGEDIVRLDYAIDDADLYYQVMVYGKNSSEAVISATKAFAAPINYNLNVVNQKILKIDAPDADTVAKCQAIADRAEYSDNDVARLQEQIKILFNDVNEVKTDIKEIKEQLANRLPLWATALMPVLTAIIGWLCAYAGGVL